MFTIIGPEQSSAELATKSSGSMKRVNMSKTSRGYTLVSFELIEGSRLESVEATWRFLDERVHPTFFLSWEVVSTWVKNEPSPPPGLQFLIGWEDGAPVAACWLLPARRGVIVPRVELHLNPIGCPGRELLAREYNDILVLPGIDTGRVLRELGQFLVSTRELSFDEIRLSALASSSGLMKHWRNYPPAGLALDIMRLSRSPSVDLDTLRSTGKDYFAYLTPHTRKQLRRAMRAYESDGVIEIQVAVSEDDAFEIFSELVELHEERWNGRGLPGAFAQPYVVRFHRSLIAACLPQKMVQMLRIRAGGRTIGCLYNLCHHGHVCVYATGFQFTEMRRPGVVAHCMAIKHNLEIGNVRYDFLPDDTLYKRCLARDSTDVVWCRFHHQKPFFYAQRCIRHARSSIGSLMKPDEG